MELVLVNASAKRVRDEISTQACNACKKRKGKCNGNPCEYCAKKGLVCEFSDGKRRGPIKKKIFPKGIREFEGVYHASLHTLQRSMNEVYHLHNFVDFYFQYFGHPIPKECKALLLTVKDKARDRELITQLYIISAHVMRFLGNKMIEAQCIAEANRHVNNIFNCDSLASAISLMMMAMYLGDESPKSYFLASTAHNIAKMVVGLKPSQLAHQIFGASKFMSITYDPSLSSAQKSYLIKDMLNAGAENGRVRAMVNVANVMVMLSTAANFDCSTLSSALSSISLPCNMPQAVRTTILEIIAQIEEGCKCEQVEQQMRVFFSYLIDYFKFIVEWRSGYTQEAFSRANSALSTFSNNRTMIGLWLQNAKPMSHLMVLPYFYQQYGALDKVHESLQLLEEYATTIGKKEEYTSMCSAFRLQSSISYSLAQIEQELLGPSFSAELANFAYPSLTVEEVSDLLPM